MGIFVGLAIVGFFILMASVIFGHDHDFEHGDLVSGDSAHEGPSWLNSKVVGAFLMFFGAAGAIARYYGLGWVPASLTGAGSGLLAGTLVYWAVKLMMSQQASAHAEVSEIIDRTGRVVLPIHGTRNGEVSLSVRGRSQAFLARAEDGQSVYDEGAVVRVKSFQGNVAFVTNAQQ